MPTIQGSAIKHVVVACEAGMGSSVLLTSQMTAKLGPLGVDVRHTPISQLTGESTDVVLCHVGLAGRARQILPDTVLLAFNMFMGDPVFAKLEAAIRNDTVLED